MKTQILAIMLLIMCSLSVVAQKAPFSHHQIKQGAILKYWDDTIVPADTHLSYDFAEDSSTIIDERTQKRYDRIEKKIKKHKQRIYNLSARQLKGEYRRFDRAYTAYKGKGFPFSSEDSVWQSIVIYNFKKMRPKIDFLCKDALESKGQLAWSVNCLVPVLTEFMEAGGQLDDEALNYTFINLDALIEWVNEDQ